MRISRNLPNRGSALRVAGVSVRRTRTHDVPSAGQGASALSPSQSRRGIAAPISILLVAVVVVALTQATVVPAATSPHAGPPGAATISWSDTGLAALRSATTTTTAPPAAPTTTTTSSTPPAPPPPSTTVPTPPPQPFAATALPARGQATAWGCDAALSYLRAYAAPGFTLQCPGNAEGHQGMTCFNVAGNCPNEAIIAIAIPCPQSYMNEASNSWVLTGRSNARIDPYGSCS